MRLEKEDDLGCSDIHYVDYIVYLHDTTDMSRGFGRRFRRAKNSKQVQSLTKSFINGIIGILN